MKAALVVLVLSIFGLLVYAEYARPHQAAKARCIETIEKGLKFPYEAKWGKIKVNSKGEGKDGEAVTVSGTVAAPNSFGVRSEFEFSCEAKAIRDLAFIDRAVLDGDILVSR